MKRIKIDRSKCVGCLTCTTACIVSHSSEDTRSRITIDSNKKYAPIFCSRTNKQIMKCDHCKHAGSPQCVEKCPMGAITFEEVNK